MKKSPCIAGAGLDGPIFEKLEDARNWCIYAMIDHYDRRLGMSDARIEPFKGMVDSGLWRIRRWFGILNGSVSRWRRSAAVSNSHTCPSPPFL
jgi:hypothetical protein